MVSFFNSPSSLEFLPSRSNLTFESSSQAISLPFWVNISRQTQVLCQIDLKRSFYTPLSACERCGIPQLYLERRNIHLLRGETTLVFLFQCLFFASTVNLNLKLREKRRVKHHTLMLKKISKPTRLMGETRLVLTYIDGAKNLTRQNHSKRARFHRKQSRWLSTDLSYPQVQL